MAVVAVGLSQFWEMALVGDSGFSTKPHTCDLGMELHTSDQDSSVSFLVRPSLGPFIKISVPPPFSLTVSLPLIFKIGIF